MLSVMVLPRLLVCWESDTAAVGNAEAKKTAGSTALCGQRLHQKLITVHRTYFVPLVGFPELENKAVTREFVAFPFPVCVLFSLPPQFQATINESNYRL